MQQMDPREAHAYTGYSGETTYPNHEESGQKLQPDSDEQFANLLVRRIQQELKQEQGTYQDTTVGHRLALAIVSICLMVPLFAGFIVALAVFHLGIYTPIIIIGFLACCAVIFGINTYFNWTIVEHRKHQK